MGLHLFDDAAPDLPHPPLSPAVFLIVEDALRAAWSLVLSRPTAEFDPLTAHEDDLTHMLYKALADEIYGADVVTGFDRQLFDLPAREPKVSNYDESHPDKMPDLLVRLCDDRRVRLRTQDGIFIECKPIGASRSVGQHYCDRGLVRFTRGDYAWAMTSALMVGYAQAGYHVGPKLGAALRDRPHLATLDGPVPCPRSAGVSADARVFVTRHGRAFRYVQTNTPAVPIEVRHLWLRRTAV